MTPRDGIRRRAQRGRSTGRVDRRKIKPKLIWGSCCLVCGLAGITGVSATQPPRGNTPEQRQAAPSDVHVLPVQGRVSLMIGAGGNITVQSGQDGVLLVDTGMASAADKVFAAVRDITDLPLHYIINTQFDLDHVGGNESLAKRGFTIVNNLISSDIAASSLSSGAAIIAQQHVLDRMVAADKPAIPSGAWPTDTFLSKQKDLFFNGEAIVIYHEEAAHTDGDSIVFFRRSDVISAGDILTPGRYPVIDLQRGGSVQGFLRALNHIIELAVPADKEEGGTYVIPGHGRICDEADVVEFQSMVTIVRDRIQDLIKKGMSLEQVKAAKPTLDYDPIYDASEGPATKDKFIEAVYKSLTQK